MKKSLILAVLALWLAIFSSNCAEVAADAVLPEPEISPTETEIEQDMAPLSGAVFLMPEDDGSTGIFIEDAQTGDLAKFGNVTGLDEARANAYQFVANQFYYVKLADNMVGELWRLSQDGTESLIYSSPSLDFRVSPNGETIAVTYEKSAEAMTSGLMFLDPSGASLQTLPFDDVDPNYWLSLEEWSSDSSMFWVSFMTGPSINQMAQVGVPGWQVAAYDLSEFHPQTGEAVLEPDSGQLVYSDMPAFFDVVSDQEFLVAQQPVHLYLRNLSSGVSIDIAQNNGRAFHPAWESQAAFSYDSSDGSGRVTYTVISGETSFTPNAPVVVTPLIVPPNFDEAYPAMAESGVAVMLPVAFPDDAGMGVYPFLQNVLPGMYVIDLAFTPDCNFAGACHYGMLAARSIMDTDPSLSLMPFFGASFNTIPLLADGTVAYFVQSECGASCSDGQLMWIYGNYEYLLGLKGAGEQDLVDLANEMMFNSVTIAE